MKEKQTSGLWMILSGAAMILTGIYKTVLGEKTLPAGPAQERPATTEDADGPPATATGPGLSHPEYFAHQAGWSHAQPESLPTPTYTPVMMAFGIIFIALGVVTKWYVAIIGVTVFAISVCRWIGEIRND